MAAAARMIVVVVVMVMVMLMFVTVLAAVVRRASLRGLIVQLCRCGLGSFFGSRHRVSCSTGLHAP